MKRNRLKMLLFSLGLSLSLFIPIKAYAWGGYVPPSTNSKVFTEGAVKWYCTGSSLVPNYGILQSNKAHMYEPLYSMDRRTWTMHAGQKLQEKTESYFGYQINYYLPVGPGCTQYCVRENFTSSYGTNESRHYKDSNHNISRLAGSPNYFVARPYNTSNPYFTSGHNNIYSPWSGNWPAYTNAEPRFVGYNLLAEPLASPFLPLDTTIPSRTYHASGVPTKSRPRRYNYYDGLSGGRIDTGNMQYRQKINTLRHLQSVEPEWRSKNIWNWARASTLTTNSLRETGIFKANRSSNGNYFTFVDKVADRNAEMVLTKIVVKNSWGKIVAKFSRNANSFDPVGNDNRMTIYENFVPGNYYTAEVTVYNNSNKATTVNPNILQCGRAHNSNATSGNFKNYFANNNVKWTEKHSRLGAHSYGVYHTDFHVPIAATGKFRFTSMVGKAHVPDDDLNINNDWGMVLADTQKGNIGAKDIYLTEYKGGPRVEHMVPGKSYFINYEYQYKGPNTDYNVNINFNSTIYRTLPKGSTDTKDEHFYYSGRISDNQVFKFTSDKMVFEVPKLTVNAHVGMYFYNISDIFDTYKEDDFASRTWDDYYDISVKNPIITPSTEKIINNKNLSKSIKYDIYYNTPPQVGQVNREIKTTIIVKDANGIPHNITFTDYISSGLNKNITHQINIPSPKVQSNMTKAIPVSVYANSDRVAWERDLYTQENNKATTYAKVKAPNNPNNAGKPGYVNGCSIDSASSNTWKVTHGYSYFSGNKIYYQEYNSPYRKHSFVYYPSVYRSNLSYNYNEQYKIDKVLFRSKYTKDNASVIGNDGWVDISPGSSQKEKAKIKAGYGYDLQIYVTYKTNAISNQPTSGSRYYDSNNQRKNNVFTLTQSPANIQNDIYVKTNDGKILSATGMYNTIRAFDSTIVANSNNRVTIKYTLKSADDGSKLKIYTNENAKDGKYNLLIFTPEQQGVGSFTSKRALCAYDKVHYTIQGSMYDDKNEHIVQ